MVDARSLNIYSTKGRKYYARQDAPTLAERIVCDADILTGKPVIKGTRLAVEFIIGLLGHGWTEADLGRVYAFARCAKFHVAR